MSGYVAKIAVSSATYWIDRPYEYKVPDELRSNASAGMRVYVPFSRSNRRTEGIILSISQGDTEKLKTIESILDESPILTADQIKLALFMRERFFCTVYDAVKAMLPVGLWLNENGSTRINDKTQEFIKLEISAEEALELAEEKSAKAKKQAYVLRELADFGELPSRELMLFTGCTKAVLNALVSSGYCSAIRKETFRRPAFFAGELSPLPRLNSEQSNAYEGIKKQLEEEKASVALLQGITGSGKTCVYISLIADVLSKGKTAILLVPEIALTPQMLQTFSSYFGNDIAVLHSSLTAGERYDEWKRAKQGKAKLVIGTRSAVFAPVENLGIIIIDEEQEDTYKSENNPRYNASDIAKYRCYKSGCMLLLGSATPNVSSRYFAETGKYSFYRIDSRYNEMNLPKVKIVDLKEELRNGNAGNISSYLKKELRANIERGEQSILFLNRRGAHKLVTCGECGYIYKCPNCSVSLTYHSINNRLICHYCGHTQKLDAKCPDCGGILKYVGAGTQLVEKELNELFPDVPVIRMDADVLSKSCTHEQVFEKFRNENIPIMIGTQMVTKGLNFENVTLVGVISADQSLYTGDYRAAEKTFSLITQVIGRGGRGEKQGRAVIQTFTPANETITQAAAQNYDDFYNSEITVRQLNDAPPFSDIICITASGEAEARVIEACECIKRMLKQKLINSGNIDILGPTPLNVVRVNNRFRYRIIIRCNANGEIRRAVSETIVLCNTEKNFRGISFYADSDPSE